ncbi:zinc finger CCCH domain-containing protein 13-like isoform X2 [Neocloeon triangulifer]|uniref:zinc finger CCCH domain-containing protein 13-like isoform X2 n=1 Tax=Neocloeon triangulifer TaxID=2078957 RepID=UPI00286F0A26|nr:zinc finger CCCH domain-containing protein 13-like isoform X2 [Neocloeon triangulifer]
MSASTSRKRKNQPVEKPSGPRPSVFDRLGTKANPQQPEPRANFCHHWRNTGNCPFGASCKNAAFHALISPSKRAKGSDKDQHNKEVANRKEVGGRNKKGKGKGDNWAELDEGELERRRVQLQKELDLQNRQEMNKKKPVKKKRSSSSSSTTSTRSSSNTSKNSSVKSSQPLKRRPRNRKRKGKKLGITKQLKEAETKRMRDNPKDVKKRSSSSGRQEQRSRSKLGTGSSSGPRKRKNSSSSDNTSAERKRQQSKSTSHQSKPKGRSPSPDKKKKQPPLSYDKKLSPRRRDQPDGRRSSPSRSNVRKRSASPLAARPRRRTPSPRGKSSKKHDSPPLNRHLPSPERKESRRGQTPPSPHDRHQRVGRGSRRNSPESHRSQQNRDSRNRPQGRSPERRPRAPSREPRELNEKRDYQRQDYNSPVPARGHGRNSPENSGRDRRDEPSRDKNRPKDNDRDKRRDDKSRDRGRGREEELPSLMTIMTQHPPQYSPRRGREEPHEHRSSTRERGRYDRYDDRGEPPAHSDDHQRSSKRPPRRESPSRQRAQKSGRDHDHPEQRDKDWDRRVKGGSSSHRDWDEQKQGRISKGHRRGHSSPSAISPRGKDQENDKKDTVTDTKLDELDDDKNKQDNQLIDEDTVEPPSKRVCHEGDVQDSGGAFERAESDFSDFSDDADDILNADVVEDETVDQMETEEKIDGVLGADAGKEEDEPVEDILDDMDFEEISDGELDAEDIKAGADALSVDWAALLNQTRDVKREESESIINRWDVSNALARIGVPQSLKGSFDLKKLGLEPPTKRSETKIEDNKVRMAFLFDKENKLQDEVPGVHAAIIMKKEEIANILNPKHHRGIDFAYGEQLRKICPFKIEKSTGIGDEEGTSKISANLKQLAHDLLRGTCDLKEVHSRLNEDAETMKVEA